MKIYHYASLDNWRGIKEGSWQSGDEPGLGANHRVCRVNHDDEGARDGAVFGLLEAEPENWVKNTEFPLAWTALTSSIGKILLHYEPTDELIDKSFIIDWSHNERLLGGHKDSIGKNTTMKMPYADTLVAEKAYWASRVKLADYIECPEAIAGIALPEVITMRNVPAALIKIADTQPRLQNLCPSDKQELIWKIEHNPELEALSPHIT